MVLAVAVRVISKFNCGSVPRWLEQCHGEITHEGDAWSAQVVSEGDEEIIIVTCVPNGSAAAYAQAEADSFRSKAAVVESRITAIKESIKAAKNILAAKKAEADRLGKPINADVMAAIKSDIARFQQTMVTEDSELAVYRTREADARENGKVGPTSQWKFKVSEFQCVLATVFSAKGPKAKGK